MSVSTHIQETRATVGRGTKAFQEMKSCLDEYIALGGADGVKRWFYVDDEMTQPRKDIDITWAEYTTAMTAISGLGTAIGVDATAAFYKLKP